MAITTEEGSPQGAHACNGIGKGPLRYLEPGHDRREREEGNDTHAFVTFLLVEN